MISIVSGTVVFGIWYLVWPGGKTDRRVKTYKIQEQDRFWFQNSILLHLGSLNQARHCQNLDHPLNNSRLPWFGVLWCVGAWWYLVFGIWYLVFGMDRW